MCRGHLKEEVIRLSGVDPQKEKRRMKREMKKTEKILKKQV
jgi:ribulose bisphosphate carboxylase small subunit